jgi:hypothetical protein
MNLSHCFHDTLHPMDYIHFGRRTSLVNDHLSISLSVDDKRRWDTLGCIGSELHFEDRLELKILKCKNWEWIVLEDWWCDECWWCCSCCCCWEWKRQYSEKGDTYILLDLVWYCRDNRGSPYFGLCGVPPNSAKKTPRRASYKAKLDEEPSNVILRSCGSSQTTYFLSAPGLQRRCIFHEP